MQTTRQLPRPPTCTCYYRCFKNTQFIPNSAIFIPNAAVFYPKFSRFYPEFSCLYTKFSNFYPKLRCFCPKLNCFYPNIASLSQNFAVFILILTFLFHPKLAFLTSFSRCYSNDFSLPATGSKYGLD